jgi:FkbM family methyltransferase
MVVVDVGAHIGYFALLAAQLVGERGRVFAFEPMPTTYQLLTMNIKANGLKNIIPIQKAVWNKSGTATFTIRPDSLGESFLGDHGYGKRTEVETICLDDFLADFGSRVDFIKMDIEGAEFTALGGMKNILAVNPRLTMITELNPAALRAMGASRQAYLGKLTNLCGFTIEAVLDGDDEVGIDFLTRMSEEYSVNLLLTKGS